MMWDLQSVSDKWSKLICLFQYNEHCVYIINKHATNLFNFCENIFCLEAINVCITQAWNLNTTIIKFHVLMKCLLNMNMHPRETFEFDSLDQNLCTFCFAKFSKVYKGWTSRKRVGTKCKCKLPSNIAYITACYI